MSWVGSGRHGPCVRFMSAPLAATSQNPVLEEFPSSALLGGGGDDDI